MGMAFRFSDQSVYIARIRSDFIGNIEAVQNGFDIAHMGVMVVVMMFMFVVMVMMMLVIMVMMVMLMHILADFFFAVDCHFHMRTVNAAFDGRLGFHRYTFQTDTVHMFNKCLLISQFA